METSSTFYKFPKTDHVSGSSVVDDDNVMSLNQLQMVGKRIIIQVKDLIRLLSNLKEKVDGANVSVHFEEEWQPIIQKRSGVLSTKEKPQYDVFRNWVYENMETLWKVLENRYCLFGEVLDSHFTLI
jgi:hypothetical protein